MFAENDTRVKLADQVSRLNKPDVTTKLNVEIHVMQGVGHVLARRDEADLVDAGTIIKIARVATDVLNGTNRGKIR